jgi:hypothetical protein
MTSLMYNGWITHLAANGASAIHDWEFASHGCSTESVENNVALGCFGTWLETGRFIHLGLLAGALDGLGFGASIGRLIQDDGVLLPSCEELERLIATDPANALTPARAELLQVMLRNHLHGGQHAIKHPWKHNSIFGQACLQNVPITVHPGIGYDIITNHPMFNGAAIGRAAGQDFRVLGGGVEKLDHGVVLSVGSAIMAPQVFEKSLSCVNNLRLQAGRKIVRHHSIYVVDLQNGGGWDWALGEPPKENPAYYLRFLKSFSRMGGEMRYLQCDNVVFLHNLLWELNEMGASDE